MFSRLQTSSLSLSEILGGSATYRVPIFQRQYSWTLENAGALLEDLLEASGAVEPEAAHPDYFLGPILFLDPDDTTGTGADHVVNGNAIRAIVDGQQRLLTLSILSSVLRDLDENSNGELAKILNNLLWFSPGNSGNGTNKIVQPRILLTDHLANFLQTYVLNEGACNEVPPELEDLAVDETSLFNVRERFLHELKDLAQPARDRLAHYVCGKCHFLVASTQDDERAHLIFKRMNERGKTLESYDLLKADVVGQVSSEDAKEVDVSWRQAQERLGPEFGALFSHLRVIHDTTRGRALWAIRAIMHKVGGAAPFVKQELAPFAEVYQQIRLGQMDQGSYAPDIREKLVSLGRLSGDEWLPATLLALKPGAFSKQETIQLIENIERYAYLVRLQMLVVYKRRRRFANIARAVREGSALTDVDNVFSISPEDYRAIFFNLRELYARSQKNCKAVLLRLNDHAAGRPVVLTPADFSVEHILPRRTKATGQWRKSFPDAEVRTVLTHSLGNLALVTEPQNQKLANKDFGSKREILMNAEARGELQPVTRDVLQSEMWDSEAIRAREDRMLRAIKDIWKISPKT